MFPEPFWRDERSRWRDVPAEALAIGAVAAVYLLGTAASAAA
jgi:hypothetical protein